MSRQEAKTITFNDARILFRNFAGKATPFNMEGIRNFCVVIPDDRTARMLEKDGWNIKRRPPKDDDGEELIILKVRVGYKGRPPRVVLITSKSRTELDEETIGMLDFAQFKLVDLIVREYNWSVGESSGITAYLQTMFVTIYEDELELRYAQDDETPF